MQNKKDRGNSKGEDRSVWSFFDVTVLTERKYVKYSKFAVKNKDERGENIWKFIREDRRPMRDGFREK